MRELGCLSSDDRREHMQQIELRVRQHIQELSGIQDTRGIEVMGLIRRAANAGEMVLNQDLEEESVSGPRLSILLRLYGDQELGGNQGVTPTMLSHMQRVSKNTISSHIAGLEDQGLIRRENDPNDRRIYRLHLTDAGRDYVKSNAPRRIGFMNSLLEDLTSEDIDQLLVLLKKVQSSLFAHADLSHLKGHG